MEMAAAGRTESDATIVSVMTIRHAVSGVKTESVVRIGIATAELLAGDRIIASRLTSSEMGRNSATTAVTSNNAQHVTAQTAIGRSAR